MESKLQNLQPEEMTGYVEQTLPVEWADSGWILYGLSVFGWLPDLLRGSLNIWSVTLTFNGAGPVQAMIAGQTWTRTAMGKGCIEGHGRNGRLETASTGLIARRRQGDIEVVLHAEAAPSDHRLQTTGTGIREEAGGLSLTVHLLTAEGHQPVPDMTICMKREKGLELVEVGKWTTDTVGRAQFVLPPGEYVLSLPTAPPLTVLLSLVLLSLEEIHADKIGMMPKGST